MVASRKGERAQDHDSYSRGPLVHAKIVKFHASFSKEESENQLQHSSIDAAATDDEKSDRNYFIADICEILVCVWRQG